MILTSVTNRALSLAGAAKKWWYFMLKNMTIKAWFKAKTADKVLAPVRELIVENISPGSTVLEIGSGTGDLLFRASEKIEYGLGVDQNPVMIRFSQKKVSEGNYKNLHFENINAEKLRDTIDKQFNVSTATLCIHEMDEELAIRVIRSMSEVSSRLLIADYQYPKKITERLVLELDELVSGHYHSFRNYRKNGGFPAIVDKCNLNIEKQIDTKIDSIALWVVS